MKHLLHIRTVGDQAMHTGVLCTEGKRPTTVNLFIDIDETLVKSYNMASFVKPGHVIADGDLVQVHPLTVQMLDWQKNFHQYQKDLINKHLPTALKTTMPTHTPSAVLDGVPVDAQYVQWGPNEPASPYVVKEVLKKDGSLSHLLLMHILFQADLEKTTAAAIQGFTYYNTFAMITIIPAAIAALCFVKYNLPTLLNQALQAAAKTNGMDCPTASMFNVDIYLASCGAEEYVRNVYMVLNALFSRGGTDLLTDYHAFPQHADKRPVKTRTAYPNVSSLPPGTDVKHVCVFVDDSPTTILDQDAVILGKSPYHGDAWAQKREIAGGRLFADRAPHQPAALKDLVTEIVNIIIKDLTQQLPHGITKVNMTYDVAAIFDVLTAAKAALKVDITAAKCVMERELHGRSSEGPVESNSATTGSQSGAGATSPRQCGRKRARATNPALEGPSPALKSLQRTPPLLVARSSTECIIAPPHGASPRQLSLARRRNSAATTSHNSSAIARLPHSAAVSGSGTHSLEGRSGIPTSVGMISPAPYFSSAGLQQQYHQQQHVLGYSAHYQAHGWQQQALPQQQHQRRPKVSALKC